MLSKLTRRALMAGVPAVVAVAAMPAIPALAVEHEPLLALWADYQRIKAEGIVIAGEYLAAEAKLPMKWQPRHGKGPIVAPAFMSEADQADRKAAFKRVGLDEIGERLDANSDLVCDAEQRVLTTMPVTCAGATIVGRQLASTIEAGMGWADETAIENLAVWLERQAGGVA